MKPGRNDPCPCGSGKKYKKCCQPQEEVKEATLAVDSSTPKAIQTALRHHQAGRLPLAETIFQQILRVEPNNPDALHFSGVIAFQRGKEDLAVELISKAIRVAPTSLMHYNLGLVLRAKDKPEAAVESYRKAISLKPDYAEAHNNLGNVLKHQGKLDEAIQHYQKALLIKPDDAGTHNNLGNLLKDQKNLDEAIQHYRKALLIKPGYVEAHNNLGNAFREQGKLDAAVEHYRMALALNPNLAELHNNLGYALKEQGKSDAAVESFRQALAFKPDYVEAHNNLGNTLMELGRLNEAEAIYRWALQIEPDFADTHNNLGVALNGQGRMDEAEASYRRALQIRPDYATAHSNLLFCISHNENVTTQALFAEHVRFGEQFEAPLRASWAQHVNSRDPDRCLQVGFVSGDFRRHAVANFIEPLLEHLSSYPQLSLHAYANHVADDDTTPRLRGYFRHWHPISGLSDAALAEKILADGIDILIDLSGHTDKNRLVAFARKPAPVQASWIGYPGTTGLSAMDYYLADRFLLPPGQFDGQLTEKIVYLPASAPFLPEKNAPPVNVLPALSNGYVTFGSFNRPSKLSPSVISLWSRLLCELPTSRMLLGAMPQDGSIDTLVNLFAREGIVRERLVFHPRCDMNAYLSLHQQVDICLDTFPYNGGTTTCHALWMGIPTLTLSGDALPGRVGAAVLGQIGLDTFVANDAADFVRKGLAWARDLNLLAGIRAELRERFAQSPRGQPAIIASGVEQALRIMWQRWCASLPAKPFEACQETSTTRIQ